MRRISRRPQNHHRLSVLPLFQWADAQSIRQLTTGGRYVHRRHHVPRELANLVAELAGIGRERE
jgi:hypothetical protein